MHSYTKSIKIQDVASQDLFFKPFSYNVSGFIRKLTLSLHPHLKAFPQSAVLATIAMVFVDDAVLFAAAAVGQVLPHAPLEEALTALTADCSVVTP